MKIAIYTIALNEEKHVKQWFDSAKEADLLLIADTGSTDGTVKVARDLGIEVHEIDVQPWRFDVARNQSLNFIPEDFDICIQIDMDEVLDPGWRELVEESYAKGNYWPTYQIIIEWNEQKEILKSLDHFKIHPRHGFSWKYPIHEIVSPDDSVTYTRERIPLKVWHRQDKTKSRKSYLALLKTAVQEMPNDWRMNHYLTREYMYVKEPKLVIQTASRGIELGYGWDVERASSCIWAAGAAHELGFTHWAYEWAVKATGYAPNFYEAWHCRAHYAHLLGKWLDCFDSASKIDGMTIHTHHLVNPEVWRWWGYDLAALSAHNLGKHELALYYGRLALEGAPEIDRLRTNLNFYGISLIESRA
jgi:glycosyltransferase involved in cell wall biosynthesis